MITGLFSLASYLFTLQGHGVSVLFYKVSWKFNGVYLCSWNFVIEGKLKGSKT